MLGMTVDARETLSANRLNGRFQSRLRSLYNLWYNMRDKCLTTAHMQHLLWYVVDAFMHGIVSMQLTFTTLVLVRRELVTGALRMAISPSRT